MPRAKRPNINGRSFHGSDIERTRRQLQLKLHATRLIRVCHEIRLDRRRLASVLGAHACHAQEGVVQALVRVGYLQIRRHGVRDRLGVVTVRAA